MENNERKHEDPKRRIESPPEKEGPPKTKPPQEKGDPSKDMPRNHEMASVTN